MLLEAPHNRQKAVVLMGALLQAGAVLGTVSSAADSKTAEFVDSDKALYRFAVGCDEWMHLQVCACPRDRNSAYFNVEFPLPTVPL